MTITPTNRKIFIVLAAVVVLAAVAVPPTRPAAPEKPVGAQHPNNATNGRVQIFTAIFEHTVGIPLAYATTTTGAAAPGAPADPDLSDCAKNIPACAIYYTLKLVRWLTTIFIALGGYLMILGLSIGIGVYNSPAVSIGFGAMLSLANLGFVLGIIVIAIATILRNQTYGMKQLLWRLILVAIIVNFSLVIVSTIIDFGDRLTLYFATLGTSTTLTSIDPASISAAFTTSLTSSFQPQAILAPPKAQSKDDLKKAWADWNAAHPNASTWERTLKLNEIEFGGRGGYAFDTANLQMAFTDVFALAVAFMLLYTAVILMVRYVYLTILLVLMPLAWLLWVFPGLQAHFQKWWTKFIHWAFYAPILLFFLYLAIYVSQANQQPASTTASATKTTSLDSSGRSVASDSLKGGTDKQLAAIVEQAQAQTPANPPAANTQQGYLDSKINPILATQPKDNPAFGTLGVAMEETPDFLVRVGQIVVILGLAMGGIFAAQALGMAGAGVAIHAAKSAGRWTVGNIVKAGKTTGRAAGRKTLQYGTAGMREAGTAESWRARAAQQTGLAGRLYWGTLARGATALERGGSANQVKRFEEGASKMSAEQLQAALPTTISNPKKVAYIRALAAKEGGLSGASADITHSKKTKDLFASYGMSRAYKEEVENGSGMNSEMYEASRELNAANKRGDSGAAAGAGEKLRQAAEEFAKTLKKADLNKMALNDLFSGKAKFGLDAVTLSSLARAFAHGVATSNNALVPSILPKMKGETKNEFGNQYRVAITEAILSNRLSAREGADHAADFKKLVVNDAMGQLVDTGAAPAAAATVPTPPTGGKTT
jgi:hypothetical protein